MALLACCCVRPSVGAFLVGVLDLVVGTIGLVTIGYLILQIQTQITELSEKPDVADNEDQLASLQYDLWAISLSFMFPAVTTVLVGLLAIISAIKRHAFLGLLAVLFNLILVVGSVVIFLILFLLGTHWIIIVPDLFGSLLQVYFLWVLNDFRLLELKVDTL